MTALTFSLMAGIFHPYYTVALAPAIGALVGIGAWVLWQHRASLVASGVLGFTIAMTTALAFELLARDASWHPWLKYVVATVGFAAALMVVGVRHLPRRIATAVAVVAAARRPGRARGVLALDRGNAPLRLDPECRAVGGRLGRLRRYAADRRPAERHEPERHRHRPAPAGPAPAACSTAARRAPP